MFDYSSNNKAKILGFTILIGITLFATYKLSINQRLNSPITKTATSTEQAAADSALSTTGSGTTTTSTPLVTKIATTSRARIPANNATVTSAVKTAPVTSSTLPTGQVTRLSNPYTTPPLSFDTVNTSARAAVVDIFCQPKDGSFAPISGSGVIIDQRGVILTNAHVAQYVLLSESAAIDLSCTIRSGSPAVAHWTAQVLYMPSVWVNKHASEINSAHPVGTGEHDYALLYITGTTDGSTLSSTFPAVSPDTREKIAFLTDQVLGVGYPAEFIGGSATEDSLYAVSSVSTITQLLTFGSTTVDAISIGSVVEAQSGSSGGGILNAWGKLVGVITTTSAGATTAQRELRGTTLSYINRDLLEQTGQDLQATLSGDLDTKLAQFNTNSAPLLLAQYIQVLESK